MAIILCSAPEAKNIRPQISFINFTASAKLNA
jgi:hypothetical protein